MLIKICGMTRQQDVVEAERLGVDMCGFVFHPKSPRAISPEDAAAIQTHGLKRVGVFVEQGVDEILQIMRKARLDYAQLHGEQGLDEAKAIGPERVIRVLWPKRMASVSALEQAMKEHAPACAMYLLEAGSSLGGSGETQDWRLLQGLNAPRPWLLAGGLNADRANEALKACTPGGMDFNSALEDSPGCKNWQKMAAAVAAVRHYGR